MIGAASKREPVMANVAASNDGRGIDVLHRLHAIVASNRGPSEYAVGPDGEITAVPASGGVVTALSGMARHVPFTWIASAATPGDRLVAESAAIPPVERSRLRFVLLPSEVYHRHYNLFSNPLLWFIQHSLADRLGSETLAAALGCGWTQGYVPANIAFAQAIADTARGDGRQPLVMIHDYHLYLVAGHLRRLLPGALLHHFVHIPWPRPSRWLLLPAARRRALLRSLLRNDVVGFQTQSCVGQFLRTCEAFVPEARVDHNRSQVRLDGHTAHVRAYPIAIDLDDLRATLTSSQVAEHERRLRPRHGERTIVRVDRLDPSKDVANGFRAFGRLLEERPEWRGLVRFLAFLVPSRGNIPEYGRYAEETFAVAQEINDRFGRPDYLPIEIFFENNRPQAMAGLKGYDVLLVNSLADGMNLVAKEGPMANERDGVLVLSTGTGAHEQLRRGALSVMPGDVAGITAAFSRALTMPLEERRRRAAVLHDIIEQYDAGDWAMEQIEDLLWLARGDQRCATRRQQLLVGDRNALLGEQRL